MSEEDFSIEDRQRLIEKDPLNVALFEPDPSLGKPLLPENGAEYPDNVELRGMWVTVTLPYLDGRPKDEFYKLRLHASTESRDPGGLRAYYSGNRFYKEALKDHWESYEDEMRKRCFRGAEFFFLHAARHGHVQALTDLGDIYSRDLCRGEYWVDTLRKLDDVPGADGEKRDSAAESVLDCERAAFSCYSKAAREDVPEACYKLGQYLFNGRECKKDLDAAYWWFVKAYEHGKDSLTELKRTTTSEIWGGAAYYLGICNEEGLGCDVNPEQALLWYRIAAFSLEEDAADGTGNCKEMHDGAVAGIERLEQSGI